MGFYNLLRKKVRNPLENWIKEMNRQFRRKHIMTNEHLKSGAIKDLFFFNLSVKS